MKICIAGKNNIAVEILLYLIELNISKKDIYVIPNKIDNGKDNWQRSLLKKAIELNIEIKKLEDIYCIKNLLFLSLEFDKIIDPDKFKSDRLYNIHFSLLPKYKGMYTSVIPILNNEKITGVTLHKIDKSIDTGPIIAQRKFKIDIMDNSRDIYLKYIQNGTLLIKQYLKKLLQNEFIESREQEFLESTYFSRNSIDFKNIKIDLNQTAINIHNQIRAFNFREYQVPNVFGVDILSSRILKSSSRKKPGTILFENDICFVISSIDYDIVLYKDKVKDLFLACKNGSVSMVNKILQIPKIINIQNDRGMTPLMAATLNNQKDIVKTLLLNGADAYICDFQGKTVLMYAKDAFLKYQDSEILELFLDLGLYIYKRDYFGKSFIDYCLENQEVEIIKILKEKGYNV